MGRNKYNTGMLLYSNDPWCPACGYEKLVFVVNTSFSCRGEVMQSHSNLCLDPDCGATWYSSFTIDGEPIEGFDDDDEEELP